MEVGDEEKRKLRDEQDVLLLEPFNYLEALPGKNIRKKLMDAFNLWLKIPTDKLLKIGEIVQMLHNASLMLDDIEDNSVLRRGAPVTHAIYGVPATINSANYVMFIALQKVIALEKEGAVEVFCEQLLELHRGQGLEMYWRDNMRCPTMDEYKDMTIKKTGGLFNLGVKLMKLFSDSVVDFTPLTSLLGLYFQIRDDYANLCLEDYATNKSFAEDLTEGKFSHPIIHGISTNQSQQIMHILRQRTSDIEVKKYCVSLLAKAGSFEFTLVEMRKLDKEIRNVIQGLGGNSNLIQIMDALKNWERN